jgi:isopentenyldiphosphate isomerase
MNPQEESLETVNDKGEVIGILQRSTIHGDPSLIHRVVHVLIFKSKGELLLQKRSMNKDVAPGKWDTSVGGHVNPGESLLDAVKREMNEELGITMCQPGFLYSYIHSNSYETELVYTYSCLYDGETYFNKEEIDKVRFWSLQEIDNTIGKNILSDNFEEELLTYKKFLEKGKKKEY